MIRDALAVRLIARGDTLHDRRPGGSRRPGRSRVRAASQAAQAERRNSARRRAHGPGRRPARRRARAGRPVSASVTAAGFCGRGPTARPATSTPCGTTMWCLRSAPPAPARPTSPWRWPCRCCGRTSSVGSSSCARPSRPASGSVSCPATSAPRSTRTCGRCSTPSTT